MGSQQLCEERKVVTPVVRKASVGRASLGVGASRNSDEWAQRGSVLLQLW